ncbi:sodium/proline symporter [Cytobacillus purgationiresistens]|uniref:Sodium/proline symporter n=1 Tax=Cytobacillus purgationiresistens TaxID=863449 RepID=A0ABU0AEB4_9BACI|nr:sodium/proline symporter [Cytobacillus purgationiresistens]MDQ0269591.1 SSS family solute:Na+ symporter/sodium/proline symporter [Cytobacillus purgationiresistens]
MITVFVIYLAIVFIIGVASERFMSKSEEGYFLGDRNFGPWATAISAGATDTSGWIFIGAAGYAYVAGISTMWMLPGFIVGYLINWFAVAPRLRKEGEALGALSMIDYISIKLKDRKNVLRVISSLIIVIFFVAYMASQLTAAGKALNSIVDFDYSLGLVLSAVFVMGYSVLGGYTSAVWTDLFQGLLMLAVLILFPIYMIFFEFGGVVNFFTTLQSIDPILLSSAGGATGAAAIGIIIGLVGFGIGEPGQPHIVQRFLSAKNDQTIRQASLIAMFWVIIVMMGSNLLGLIGRISLPGLADPEYVFPTLVGDTMHPIISGIIIGAIFAAIQSTFSSQLMVATQSLASDILKSVTKRTYSNKQMIIISRFTMVGLGTIATLIALMNIESVFQLVLYAWAGLAASFGPVVLLLLYTNIVTIIGAISGIITGTVVTIIWINTPWQPYMYELIPAAILSTIVVIVVSKFTKE